LKDDLGVESSDKSKSRWGKLLIQVLFLKDVAYWQITVEI